MKTIILLLALLTLASPLYGAQLKVTGTAPTQTNSADCGVTPVLGTMVATSVWVVMVYVGPSMGIDSLLVSVGAPFSFTKVNLLPGTYNITVRVKNSAGYSCPATLTKSIEDVPNTPVVN